MVEEDNQFKGLVRSISKDKNGLPEINPKYWSEQELSLFLQKHEIYKSLNALSLKQLNIISFKKIKGHLNGEDFLINGIYNCKIDKSEKELLIKSKKIIQEFFV